MKKTSTYLGALMLLLLTFGCADEPARDFTELDARARAVMETLHLPGLALCVARHDRIDFCRSYGVADRDTGRVVTEHTPFLLASITKTITATATMTLVEAGKLTLDMPLRDLVDFPFGHPQGAAPTLRHVFTHTSAIEDDSETMEQFYTLGQDPAIPLDEIIRGYFQPGGAYYDAEDNFLDHAVGTSYVYSNMAFALAGRIDEIASGEDFRDLVDRAILEPLHMRDSSMRLESFPQNTVAVPYNFADGEYETFGHYTFADYPDGGLFASAHDLALFGAAIGDETLLARRGVLEPETRRAMLERQLGGNTAIAWIYTTLGEETVYGHAGGEFGVYTSMLVRERDGTAVVALSNGSPAADDTTMTAVLEALFVVADGGDHAR